MLPNYHVIIREHGPNWFSALKQITSSCQYVTGEQRILFIKTVHYINTKFDLRSPALIYFAYYAAEFQLWVVFSHEIVYNFDINWKKFPC